MSKDSSTLSLESNLLSTVKKANGSLFMALQVKNRELQAYRAKDTKLNELKQQYELQLSELQQFYSGLGDIFQNMTAMLPPSPDPQQLIPYLSKTALKTLTSITPPERAESVGRKKKGYRPDNDDNVPEADISPYATADVFSSYLGLSVPGSGDDSKTNSDNSEGSDDDDDDDRDHDNAAQAFFDGEEKYHQQDAVLQGDFLSFRRLSRRVKTDLARKRSTVATALTTIVKSLSQQSVINTSLLSSPHATALIATAVAARETSGNTPTDPVISEEELTTQLAKQVEHLRRLTIEQQRTIHNNKATIVTVEQSLLHYKALAMKLKHDLSTQEEKIQQFEKLADRHRFTQNELFSQDSVESTNDDLADYYRAELLAKKHSQEDGTATVSDVDTTTTTTDAAAAAASKTNGSNLSQMETLQQLSDVTAQLAQVKSELVSAQTDNVTLKDENQLLSKQVQLVQAQQAELLHGHLATMSTELAAMTNLYQVTPPPSLPPPPPPPPGAARPPGPPSQVHSQQLSLLAKHLGIQLSNYQQVNQAFAIALRTLAQHAITQPTTALRSQQQPFTFGSHTTLPTMQFITLILIFNSAFTQLSQQHQHEFTARQTLSKQLKLLQQQRIESVKQFQQSIRTIVSKAQAIQYQRNLDFEQLMLEKHTTAVQVQQLSDELYHVRSQLLHDPELAHATTLTRHTQRIKDLEKRLLIQELVNKELLVQATSSNIPTQIKTRSVTFVRFLYNMLIQVKVDCELKVRAMEEKLIRQSGVVNYHGWVQNQLNAQQLLGGKLSRAPPRPQPPPPPQQQQQRNRYNNNASRFNNKPQSFNSQQSHQQQQQQQQFIPSGLSRFSQTPARLTAKNDPIRTVQLRNLFQTQINRVIKDPSQLLPPPPSSSGAAPPSHTSSQQSRRYNNNNNFKPSFNDHNNGYFGSKSQRHNHNSNDNYDGYDPLPPPPGVPPYYNNAHPNSNPNNFHGSYNPHHKSKYHNPNYNRYNGDDPRGPPGPNPYNPHNKYNRYNNHDNDSNSNNQYNQYNNQFNETTGVQNQQQPNQQQQPQQPQQPQPQQPQQPQQQPPQQSNQPITTTTTTTTTDLAPNQPQQLAPIMSAPPNIPLGLNFRPTQVRTGQENFPLLDLEQYQLIHDSSHSTPLVGILDSSVTGHPSSFYDSFHYPFVKHYKQGHSRSSHQSPQKQQQQQQQQQIQSRQRQRKQPITRRQAQRNNFIRVLSRLRSVPYHTYHQLQESHFGIWIRCAYMYQYVKQLQQICLVNHLPVPKFSPPMNPRLLTANTTAPQSTALPPVPLNYNLHTLYDWHYDPHNISHFDQLSNQFQFNIDDDSQLNKLPQEEQIAKLKARISELKLDLETSNDIIREMEPIVNRDDILAEPSLIRERRAEYSRIEQYEHYIAHLETKLTSVVKYIDNFKHLHTYHLPADQHFSLANLYDKDLNDGSSSLMQQITHNLGGNIHGGNTPAHTAANSNITTTTTTTGNTPSNNMQMFSQLAILANLDPNNKNRIVTNPTPNFFVRSTYALQDVCRILTRQVLSLSSQVESMRHTSFNTSQQIDFYKTQSTTVKSEMERLLQLIDLIVTSTNTHANPIPPPSTTTTTSGSSFTTSSRSPFGSVNINTANPVALTNTKYYDQYLKLQTRIFNTLHQLYIKYPILNANRINTMLAQIPALINGVTGPTTPPPPPSPYSSAATTSSSTAITPILARRLAATIKTSTFNTAAKNKMIRFVNQLQFLGSKLEKQSKDGHSISTKLAKSQEEYNRLFAQNEQTVKQLATSNNAAKASKSSNRETDNLLHKITCSICSIREKSAVISGCGHTLCWTCMDSALRVRNRKCPICATTISQSQVHQMRL